MHFEGEDEPAICVCEFVDLQSMLCKVILFVWLYNFCISITPSKIRCYISMGYPFNQ